MGDHNTRMQELRREVDILKGSMEGVVSSVTELQQSMDTKVAQAMEDIKRLLTENVNPRNGDGEDRRAHDDNRDRGVPILNHNCPVDNRNYQVDLPHFDGTGLKDWLYRCEQFFDVDETSPDAKVKIVSCKLDGKALQWHQSYMKQRLTR